MLNLSHNSLEEFSMQDIRGLRHLASLDISHNRIVKLGGRLEVRYDYLMMCCSFGYIYTYVSRFFKPVQC